MKRIRVSLALCLVVALMVPSTLALAASATGQTWTASITYYTPSTTSGSLDIVYYDGLTTYIAGPFTLNPHAAGSVSVGSTSGMPDPFTGSAVLSADVPIIATYVQYSKTELLNYSRVFYSAFDPSKAGTKYYLPTVRANGVTTSRIGVQNTSAAQISATLAFYSVTNPTVIAFSHTVLIQPNASYVASLPSVPGYTGSPFDGSLVVTATGSVVATAQETQDNGRGAFGYEGFSQGATLIYSPTATCNRAPNNATSYFAIQNAGTSSANVKISYYNTAGTKVGEMPVTAISPGAKLATNPCLQGLLVDTLGSAVIESTNAVPLTMIGKYMSNDGLITAFVGEPAGYTKVAAPYIRWAADASTNYRSYIAVMNVGSSNATNIVARYYDASGTLRGSETLASGGSPLGQYIKRNTNPSTAGALSAGSFGISPAGGAMEITSDQPIVVLVRLTTNPVGLDVVTLGEDYNAVPVP